MLEIHLDNKIHWSRRFELRTSCIRCSCVTHYADYWNWAGRVSISKLLFSVCIFFQLIMKRQDSPNEQDVLMSDHSGRAPSYSSFSNTNNQENENSDSDGFLLRFKPLSTPKPEIKVYNYFTWFLYIWRMKNDLIFDSPKNIRLSTWSACAFMISRSLPKLTNESSIEKVE